MNRNGYFDNSNTEPILNDKSSDINTPLNINELCCCMWFHNLYEPLSTDDYRYKLANKANKIIEKTENGYKIELKQAYDQAEEYIRVGYNLSFNFDTCAITHWGNNVSTKKSKRLIS